MAKMVDMSAEEALRAMRAGDVPPRMRVEGDLGFYQQDNAAPPRALPEDELVAGSIIIHDASLLTRWPRLVRCHTLYVWKLQIDFPPDVAVELVSPVKADRWYGLALQDCPRLTRFPLLGDRMLREVRIDACPALAGLPAGLRVGQLVIWRCPALESLGEDLQVTSLEVVGCPRLSRLPAVLHAASVSLAGCEELEALPDDCAISEELNLTGCANLERLPDTVEALRLSITNCRRLTALPGRLRSLYVGMSGCAGIERWDDPEVTVLRQLSARGCARLASLPPNLRQIDELDVSGCPRLTHLPGELRITRWVDVGGSGVRALPASAQGAQVHWNGVNVTAQVAFHPESLTARQALMEENAEIRRIMLERIGPERFIAEARPEELDADTDAGGARRLLRVEIPNDEPFIALQVRDPSTGRQYLLRVPPDTDTCRRAAAWIAGFDDPDAYQPLLET